MSHMQIPNMLHTTYLYYLKYVTNMKLAKKYFYFHFAVTGKNNSSSFLINK